MISRRSFIGVLFTAPLALCARTPPPYEEGTWIPRVNTLMDYEEKWSAKGHYVKVGNVVMVYPMGRGYVFP